ncbi:MAG: ElyC/SanA/YdcF family protein [Candidatus Saccharibacteria bacterium]|nr:ElyC/SanA/YdcF family protein [Candidatus Saccharibacteria bacterium]
MDLNQEDILEKHSILSKLRHKRTIFLIISLLFLFVFGIIVFCNIYVSSFKKYIIMNPSTQNYAKIGIVFGSGVDHEGKPYKELQARLDSAAETLEAGIVDKLIVSGDNRFLNYNEPIAMTKYLVEEKGIDATKIQPDYAGRSTYETCERAAKIFSVKKAILFSANSHLPRAIFTCRSFGIESYGIGNNAEANNATRRELLAKIKSMFNVYIYGEKTILGDPIEIN